MHEWLYVKENLLGETEVGPIPESEFRQMLVDGALKSNSKICSPTRTKGQWVFVSSIPGLVKIVEDGEKQKAEEAERVKQAKAEAKRKAAEAIEKKKESSSLPKAQPFVDSPPFSDLPPIDPPLENQGQHSSMPEPSRIVQPKRNFVALTAIMTAYYVIAGCCMFVWLVSLGMFIISIFRGALLATFPIFIAGTIGISIVVVSLCAIAEFLRVVIAIEDNTRRSIHR